MVIIIQCNDRVGLVVDIDDGPIIVQKITKINHSHKLADLIKAGRENETAALIRAMQLVFEDRVFVYKNKSVVFE